MDFGSSPQGERTIQFAALCYRSIMARTQVLMITSRDTRRWILPKGWPIAGLAPAAVAAREAFEEAGVLGLADDTCLGRYDYLKQMSPDIGLVCDVAVHPLRVSRLLHRYPESGQRRRKWMSPAKAAACVAEPGLQAMLAAFVAPTGADPSPTSSKPAPAKAKVAAARRKG